MGWTNGKFQIINAPERFLSTTTAMVRREIELSVSRGFACSDSRSRKPKGLRQTGAQEKKDKWTERVEDWVKNDGVGKTT